MCGSFPVSVLHATAVEDADACSVGVDLLDRTACRDMTTAQVPLTDLAL